MLPELMSQHESMPTSGAQHHAATSSTSSTQHTRVPQYRGGRPERQRGLKLGPTASSESLNRASELKSSVHYSFGSALTIASDHLASSSGKEPPSSAGRLVGGKYGVRSAVLWPLITVMRPRS